MDESFTDWINRQIAADEWWAREASREGDDFVPAGAHWVWVEGDLWRPVTPDPTDPDFYANGLCSVEEFPTDQTVRIYGGDRRSLPMSVIHGDVSNASVAGYIVRHDPAATMLRIAADRAIVDLHKPFHLQHWHDVIQCGYCAAACHSRSGLACDEPDAPYPCDTLRVFALRFADREGYLDEWKPQEES